MPVTIDLERPELLGTLTMGYLLDAERAGALKALDRRRRRLRLRRHGPRVVVPGRHRPGGGARGSTPISTSPSLAIADEDYSALVRPLAGAVTSAPPGDEPPRAVVLRSRTARMQTLGTIRTALAGIALATVALAAVLSYAIARTVTKPLATITAHMREVAATGDLTRKVALPPRRGTTRTPR